MRLRQKWRWLGPRPSRRGRKGGPTWKACLLKKLDWRLHCSNRDRQPGSCRYALTANKSTQ